MLLTKHTEDVYDAKCKEVQNWINNDIFEKVFNRGQKAITV